jgi:hypothetical protein
MLEKPMRMSVGKSHSMFFLLLKNGRNYSFVVQ